MADLFNPILLFIPIFFIITLSASIESNESKLPLQLTQPVVLIKKPFPSRKKGLTASFGTIFGNNPYFCNSFAFAQLDYLPPLPMQCDLFSPVLSFRYLVADKKTQGFSIGGGTRYYSIPFCSVLGLNVFYDFKSIPCNHFYQIGFGFEYLRFLNCISLLELRANVYLPLNKHSTVKAKYCYYPEKYIAIGTNKLHNHGGWDIEIGKRVFYKNLFDLYFSIAPYHLFSQEYGVQYNGIFRWKSIAYAGIQLYQNISCSQTDITGIIGINLPLDSSNICEKNMLLRIPLSRWETIKLRSCLYWRTNY